MLNKNNETTLDEILIKNNKITRTVWDDAAKEANDYNQKLILSGRNNEPRKKAVQILLEKQLLSPKDVAEATAEQLDLPLYNKDTFNLKDVDKTLLRQLRDVVASDIKAMPVRKTPDGKIEILAVDPSDMRMKIRLKAIFRVEFSFFNFIVISSNDFDTIFNQSYKLDLGVESIKNERKDEFRNSNRSLLDNFDGGAIVDIVDTLLREAIKSRASDIHIESTETNVVVRYRIDTIPVIVQELSVEIEPMLIQRFFLECNVPIDKKNKPQDGRFERVFDGKRYDFRVNFMPLYLPTRLAVKIAIRILNMDKVAANIEEIGFTSKCLEDYKRMITQPQGLILVVGPMGSGKTTTLYSTIAYLGPKDRVIITLEDPPEFSTAYVTQSKIESEIGYNFADGLKAILRQDADIILLGEIRDTEVGSLAVEASIIGRLVLSTLHADSAISTILRLSNLEIPAESIATALVGVASQRLVRRICTSCKEEYTPDPYDIKGAEALLGMDLSNHKFYKGKGCDKCNHTGYIGLIPTYEILNFKEIPALKSAVADGNLSIVKLTDIAVANGYRPMVFDGYEKVINGFTTFDEINRIVIDATLRNVVNEAIKKKEEESV